MGYIAAPAIALSYPWTHFICGHLGRLATRDDVAVHQHYIADIEASSSEALQTVNPVPYYVHYGENVWAGVKAHLDDVTERAAAPVIAKYTGVLAAADIEVFTRTTTFADHAVPAPRLRAQRTRPPLTTHRAGNRPGAGPGRPRRRRRADASLRRLPTMVGWLIASAGMARAGHPAHGHRRARRPAEQPAGRRRRRAAVADGRRGRRVRVGQDVAGHRHAVRRGHAPVPGGPEHLQPPAADPGPAAGRGPDRPPAARAGAAAAPADTRAAQHGRHDVRGAQRAAPDDVAAGLAPVPERPPRRAVDRHARRGDRLPGVRRAFRAPQRRVLRLQLLRRVPGLPGPGRAVRGRRQPPWFPTRTRRSRKARCCRGTPAGGGCRCTPRASSGSGSTCRTGR